MIRLEHITINQGAFGMRDVCLDIPQGAYAVMMGSTGSGKTTLLEVICGLRQPDSGRILIGGKDVTRATPAARDVGYVPQDGALFKTMSVFEQIAFALSIRRAPSAIIAARVEELAGQLGITHLLDRTPIGMSGGERQRVALARALSFRPGVLLLDEPLSALDDETRSSIMALLKQVSQKTGITALHVTHNRAEADQLGSMNLHIRQGQVLPM